jgi:hypothetical protein
MVFPRDDGGDREVEAGGTVALVFEGAVPDLPVTMDKQGAGLCLSCVRFGTDSAMTPR